ncbi:ABC transporter substrate binding protein [Methanospirillum hungatei]|jgi:PAS domain S-box-containing protein|uniref:ABC transporter substrate binding protein n=1 Tax=Methanospirillum hungatei TaxID=2203 RepID=UPI002CA2A542|nr:ABC transporter substrate binding protein [Methanospirillum hungatei]HOW03599.1 ABC transporter substrate binding protein [Methanospirillum hungatei]
MDRSLTIHTILRLFALLVMALLLSTSIGAASNQDNGQFILVLHSYNPTLTWTANISQGILAGLGPLPANTSISFEYLNWKNYPTEENLNLVEDLLRYRYKNLPVDLLITTDDAALIFGLKHRTEIFSDAPIIFTALNGFDEIRPDTYPKTTGVIEAINPEDTIDSIFRLFPDTKHILVLCEYTESGKGIAEIIRKASRNYQNRALFTYIGDITTGEVYEEVRNQTPGTAILIGSWSVDKTGAIVEIGQFAEKVAAISQVPVFNLYDFNTGRGTVGGSILSGYRQGYIAGQMASEILSGKEISQIPIVGTDATQLIFDYAVLERFKVPKERIPPGSILLHTPPAFIEQYYGFIMAALLVIIILAAALITLLSIMLVRRRTEKLMMTLLDALPGYAFLKDRNGVYQYANQTLCDTIGVRADEIKGKTDYDLFPHEIATRYQEQDDTVIASGKPFFIPEETILEKSGTKIPLTVRKVPITDAKGSVTGVIGLAFDITEQKAAREELLESHEKYYNLFELGKEAIFLIDQSTGEIREANLFAVEMYGYLKSELIGMNITSLSAEPDTTRILSSEVRTGTFAIPLRYHQKKSGVRFPVEIIGRFFDWKGKIWIVAAIRDISERLRTEDAIRKATEKLNLFNYLTRTTMNNQLFILRGYLDFAADIVRDPDAEKYLERSRSAVRSIDRLVLFMKNYQDMGLKPAVWQNVEEVFIYAISHLSMGGITREIFVKGLFIYADPFLEKVFLHLVENSITHGERVTIIGIRTEQDGEDLLLIYEDNGIGVPSDYKEQILSLNLEGKAGIGLILVREILAITGISITETGEYGTGARFVMRVPKGNYRFESGIT